MENKFDWSKLGELVKNVLKDKKTWAFLAAALAAFGAFYTGMITSDQLTAALLAALGALFGVGLLQQAKDRLK